jgi:hypothetical protein
MSKEKNMKYICLGYMDETFIGKMNESERNAFIDECFGYDVVLNHAIQLMSDHPSLRLGRGNGNWEIRPAADLSAMIDESEQRRGDKK